MYRTDKQFMTNPATASSRIYIGFLPKTAVAADLEEKFCIHGKILGLHQQQGFAFIQFENDNQAQNAIQKENGSMLHNRRIVVKQALDKSQQKGGPFNANKKPGGPPPYQQQQQHQQQSAPQPLNEPPPLRQQPQNNQFQQQKPPQQKLPLVQEQALPVEQDKKDSSELAPAPVTIGAPAPTAPKNITPTGNTVAPIVKNHQPVGRNNTPNVQDDHKPKSQQNLNFEGPPEKRMRKRPMRMRSRERFQGGGDSYRDDYYSGGPYVAGPPPIIDQPDRNDCEIIVVSKALTKYAEYIEQRLKSLGLIVDLLFPNEDVPIGRVLANISSRGCLYAILVMPQNEEHRSLTLNVLHGMPQGGSSATEHRNMPIEDALILIARNFDAYMRGDKTATETLGPGGVMNISDRHPTTIQLLFNLLAENRQITSTQYDRLMKYLQERRELQQQHEISEGVDQDSQGSTSKQTELQNRIMNILNNKTPAAPEIVAPVVAEVAPQVEAAAAAPPPLLKDPSVQKALDSLLGGDMFKTISGAH